MEVRAHAAEPHPSLRLAALQLASQPVVPCLQGQAQSLTSVSYTTSPALASLDSADEPLLQAAAPSGRSFQQVPPLGACGLWPAGSCTLVTIWAALASCNPPSRGASHLLVFLTAGRGAGLAVNIIWRRLAGPGLGPWLPVKAGGLGVCTKGMPCACGAQLLVACAQQLAPCMQLLHPQGADARQPAQCLSAPEVPLWLRCRPSTQTFTCHLRPLASSTSSRRPLQLRGLAHH